MSRLSLTLIDFWNRPVTAELVVRRDTVEAWCDDKQVGTCDRDHLHRWLREPDGMYAYDEMVWLPVPDGVALAIENIVLAWPLPDHILSYLRTTV